jgi:hypothetical protein
MFNTNNIPPMVISCDYRGPSLHAIKNAKIGFIDEEKIQRVDSWMKENKVYIPKIEY